MMPWGRASIREAGSGINAVKDALRSAGGTDDRNKREERDKVINKNLRRLRCLVTAQTMTNLERLTAMSGGREVGRTIDKLVREKMLSLRQPEAAWREHFLIRFKEAR